MLSPPEAAAHTKQYGQRYSKALEKYSFYEKRINYCKDAEVNLDFKC